MLEKFKDKQPLFYEEVCNSIKNKKISHAYLIETNDYEEADCLVIEFIKTLFHASIQDTPIFENVCNLIDNNSYSDFITIDPDGAWIKKEQILDVKEKFKMTSFQENPRIYLINSADKLNKYAANSLLKFLEEPEGNIIAVLVTSNRYKVLETIRSRCQIYSLLSKKKNKEFADVTLLENVIETLENKKEMAVAFLPTVLENDYRNKEFWNNLFYDMIEVYENALRKKENIDYVDYGQVLDVVINNNTRQETTKNGTTTYGANTIRIRTIEFVLSIPN